MPTPQPTPAHDVGLFGGGWIVDSGGAVRVYNETPISEEWNPTHKGVRAHDSPMGKDSGVGAGSAVTDGDVVSEG